YARFSQAIALMPALNGYGTLTGTISEDGTQSISEDNAAETFITSGLSKVLKINNICSENYQDCGFPAELTGALGSKMDTPAKISDLFDANIRIAWSGFSYEHLDTKAAAFETANGESLLAFYNPTCTQLAGIVSNDGAVLVPDKVCANFIYDLNGTKGPNTFGKDIGLITVFYPSDSVVVAPMPYLRGGDLNVDWRAASSSCKNIDSEYRAPNLEEMMALMYNHDISDVGSDRYWTTTREDSSRAWIVSSSNRAWAMAIGNSTGADGVAMSVRCVKR
ncbi:MAG: fibrobacter succinogenes major paralogous domain-containing protein, partial [Fusobacterium sp.]|nr:fibrobacter succinogenes major paralogous domain-containing protein [Fusobacterium sp.]